VYRLLPKWRHSSKRLVLVDLEGTLWMRDVRSAAAVENGHGDEGPPEEVVEVLKGLAEDKRNEVWVLSGLPEKGALERIVERVPMVGVVAENGCFIRPRPTKSTPSPAWIDMVVNFNLTWKTLCMEMLNYFTERTPGSFIEEREASIVWRFWTGDPTSDSADRQWAQRQAAEAQNHIFDSLGERYGLRIIPGANSFLVLPNNVSRSTAVGAILHSGGPTQSPHRTQPLTALDGLYADLENGGGSGGVDATDADRFMLAVTADEKLLRRLNEFDNAETCSTSGKGTNAKWKLDPRGTNGGAVGALRQFVGI